MIEIAPPLMDPTVRKKPRYEHSLSRIVRKNPRIISTINKINSVKTNIDEVNTTNAHESKPVTSEQLPDTKSETVIISDEISNISSTPSIDANNDSEPDINDQQLSADLSVSDSDEDSDIPNIPTTSDIKIHHIPSDQDSTSENTDTNSITDQEDNSTSKPIPYEVEVKHPIPAYVPTPKQNKEETRKRAARYIPVSKWMFDQWRIICKANQRVGDAMRDAMIKEGQLHIRK